MREYTLDTKALVMVQGSSKGTQPKYYDDGYWYKANSEGYEGLAEYLVSLVLKCSNIKDYVVYEPCKINGKSGCRSKTFLSKRESFISFERLHEVYEGGHLLDRVRVIPEPAERIQFVKQFVMDTVGIDCSEYLSQVLSLDMLTLNIDRHFNNLGVIIDNESGICRPAPVFDNGAALLSSWGRFNEETIEENITLVCGQPFCANLRRQALEAGIGLQIDYRRLETYLSQEPDSRALRVLDYQLEANRDIIPNFHLREECLEDEWEHNPKDTLQQREDEWEPEL